MFFEDKEFIANVATMEALSYMQKVIPSIQLSKQDIEAIENVLIKCIDSQKGL